LSFFYDFLKVISKSGIFYKKVILKSGKNLIKCRKFLFKLFLSDVGILTRLLEINYSDIILDKNFMYKGVIAENYVATELQRLGKILFYWNS